MEEIDNDIKKQGKEVRRLIRVTTFNTNRNEMQKYLRLTCGNLTKLEKLYAKKIEQNT